MGGGSSKTTKKKVSDITVETQKKQTKRKETPVEDFIPEIQMNLNKSQQKSHSDTVVSSQKQTKDIQNSVVFSNFDSKTKTNQARDKSLVNYAVKEDISNPKKALEGREFSETNKESYHDTKQFNLNDKTNQLNMLSSSIETRSSIDSFEQPNTVTEENYTAKNVQKKFALTPRGAYSKIILV